MLHQVLRQLVKSGIWVALCFCLILDGEMGEGAISGYGDVFYLDEHGRFTLPGREPKLWFLIAGLILFQGVLIFTLIRLRRQEHLSAADRLRGQLPPEGGGFI